MDLMTQQQQKEKGGGKEEKEKKERNWTHKRGSNGVPRKEKWKETPSGGASCLGQALNQALYPQNCSADAE